MSRSLYALLLATVFTALAVSCDDPADEPQDPGPKEPAAADNLLSFLKAEAADL